VAIRGVDTVLTVTNTGTITGQVLDPPPPGRDSSITLNNEVQGVLNAGPNIEADVNNAGLIAVRGPGAFNHTQITGNLAQSSSGRLLINADFNTQQADTLGVGGAASLAGLVELRTSSILPQRPIEILSATGGVDERGIAVSPATLFGFGLIQRGDDLLVSASSANFALPAAALSRSEGAVANGLQAVWDAGGNPVFGRFFSALDVIAGKSPSAYAQELNQLSPRASVALGARIPAENHDFTDAMLSCPEFADGTALVIDGRCMWGRFIGRFTSQGAADGIPAFDVNTYTYQVGGEFAVATDWLVDGALAFQTSNLDSHNDSSTGSGRGGYGGAALKWQPGLWRFAFAVSGSYGRFDTSREIATPVLGGPATASPAVYSIAARVRSAYNWVYAGGYVRPYLDLDLIHTHTPGYTESGPPNFSLFFAPSGQTTFVATPAVQIGRRIDFDSGVALRPYAGIGVSLFSNSDWQVQSGFVGAPAGAGLFTTTISEGHAVGRVSAGIQLLGVGNLDLRLRYDGAFAANATSHAGLFTAAWRF
ncbi:MAG TPA: autotransporter outer membrane beta-barrel domain-containing protein, partial [Stellaceae bacterium]